MGDGGDGWDSIDTVTGTEDIPNTEPDITDGQSPALPRACDNCKKLKRKCSGHQPCQQCVRKNMMCVYSNPRKRGPKKVRAQFDVPAHTRSTPIHVSPMQRVPPTHRGLWARSGKAST